MKIKFKLKERDINMGGQMDRGQPDRMEAPMEEREKLKGGAGDNRPDSAFDQKQLATGIEDETGEHTPDKQIGKEIAKDHLTNDPDYYIKLKAAGLDEYMQLHEEEKKAAVMMGELMKQLEIHSHKIWVFFDTETTGIDPHSRQLTEIAAMAVKPDFSGGNAQTISQYHKKIELTPETKAGLEKPYTPKNARDKSPKEILQMTQYFTSKGEKVDEASALKGFIEYIKGLEKQGEVVLLAHNAQFDRKHVSVRSEKYGLEKLNNKTIDTLDLVYEFFYPLLIVADKENLLSKLKSSYGKISFTMGTLTNALNINNKDWHTAIADVTALISVTQQIINRLQQERGLDVRAGYEKAKKAQLSRNAFSKKKTTGKK